MTFRSRLLVISLATALVPIVVLAALIHREMSRRLTTQYEQRVDALVGVIEEDLDQQGRDAAASLDLIRRRIVDDNRFRQAAVDRTPEQRRYLLDYASDAMPLAGLSMLQIQDEDGRIISSGHFRNEFDRLEPGLPDLLEVVPGGWALVEARAPDAPFVALAAMDAFDIGGHHFTLVGGVRVEANFLSRLARGEEMRVTLALPDDASTAGKPAGISRDLEVPYIGAGREIVTRARFRVSHRLDELRALRASINRWFLVTVAAAVLLSIIVVGWLSSRISRPIVALAEKTSHIDLDRLDVDFDTHGNDEVGALSRMLGAMTERLRASARAIKDAERRAAMGELARQVNHDIKNGLTPIRNVLKHLDELSRSNEKDLSRVFRERQGTLHSGIAYLENLATNYARLSPRRERQRCDVDDIIRAITRDLQASSGANIEVSLSGGAVMGDPVSLRRVFENLITNAMESLDSAGGRVKIATETVATEDGGRIRVVVADTGVGMTDEDRRRIFDDFYTTKDAGTGLGLSIVRRLVMDLDGTIRVESEKGKGSLFIVELPSAEAAQKERNA